MIVKVIATTQPLDFEPQVLIEYAGRVCTNTLSNVGRNTERFIRQRIDEQHLGLLEHNYVTFSVAYISRACANQLVRHRLASYAQRSERFSLVTKYDGTICPDSVFDKHMEDQYFGICLQAYDLYDKMIASGINMEDARFILPQGAETSILVTMNLRSYLHLFEMRISPAAQWEIREMCMHMLDALLFYAPAVFVPFREKLAEKYPNLFEGE